jgi:hypothetical protein
MNRKRIDLPWEVCGWVTIQQKSAEVIVGGSNEPSERMEDSQTTEGPNVRRAKELGSL